MISGRCTAGTEQKLNLNLFEPDLSRHMRKRIRMQKHNKSIIKVIHQLYEYNYRTFEAKQYLK